MAIHCISLPEWVMSILSAGGSQLEELQEQSTNGIRDIMAYKCLLRPCIATSDADETTRSTLKRTAMQSDESSPQDRPPSCLRIVTLY
eukprot:2172238-Amphidinium_carterae.1